MKFRGFTLIEILVALAIVAIALGAALRATSAALGSSVEIQDRTIARWVAKNELARLQTLSVLPPPGKQSGEVRQANVDWSWEAVIDTTPNPNFRQVQIVVRRQGTTHSLASLQGFVIGWR